MSGRSLDTGAATGEAAAGQPLIGPVGGPGLHVMTWNIRRKMPAYSPRSADRWDVRAPRLQALLHAERPSLLGVQEALPEQAAFVAQSLGRHRSVGQGRNADGGGEGSPVLYDPQRLELLEWEQLALSNTPARPGSRSWGNMVPRMLVAATFADLATSARFLAINTHFDHISRTSRLQSARAIQQLVADKSLPAVVLGDLNAGAGTAPLQELLGTGALVDAWAAAAVHDSREWGTFPNYQEPRPGRKRIDWMLCTPDVLVSRAAINPARFAGGWASDHLPVQGVLEFPAVGEGP